MAVADNANDRAELVEGATELRKIADSFESLAEGQIEPGSDEYYRIGLSVRIAIRDYLARWL